MEFITYEVENQIGIITINRPKALNALNSTVLDELDATSAETKATYEEIKEYVKEKYQLKVSNLYISQIKRKCGIEVGINYNLPKSENSRVPQCPPEKEKAIREALEYFQMIS